VVSLRAIRRPPIGQGWPELLHRGVAAVRSDAPEADQEVQWNQGQLPEKEKQHGIQGAEYAQGDALQQQQQGVIQARQCAHRVPGGGHHAQHEE